MMMMMMMMMMIYESMIYQNVNLPLIISVLHQHNSENHSGSKLHHWHLGLPRNIRSHHLLLHLQKQMKHHHPLLHLFQGIFEQKNPFSWYLLCVFKMDNILIPLPIGNSSPNLQKWNKCSGILNIQVMVGLQNKRINKIYIYICVCVVIAICVYIYVYIYIFVLTYASLKSHTPKGSNVVNTVISHDSNGIIHI